MGQSRNRHGRQKTACVSVVVRADRAAWRARRSVRRSPRPDVRPPPRRASRRSRSTTKTAARAAMPTSAPRLVRPTRFTTRADAPGACARSQDSIARAASRSCAAPTITHDGRCAGDDPRDDLGHPIRRPLFRLAVRRARREPDDRRQRGQAAVGKQRVGAREHLPATASVAARRLRRSMSRPRTRSR